MSSDLVDPSTDAGPLAARNGLPRELDFYVGTWSALRPHMIRMGQCLLKQGFKETEGGAGMTTFVGIVGMSRDGPGVEHTCQITLHTNIRPWLTDPTSLHPLLSLVAAPDGGTSQSHTPDSVHLNQTLLDIIHTFSSLLSSHSHFSRMVVVPPSTVAAEKPPVAWLNKHEDMLRETMGCSFFRELKQEAGRV